jgi:hypothetical protein
LGLDLQLGQSSSPTPSPVATATPQPLLSLQANLLDGQGSNGGLAQVSLDTATNQSKIKLNLLNNLLSGTLTSTELINAQGQVVASVSGGLLSGLLNANGATLNLDAQTASLLRQGLLRVRVKVSLLGLLGIKTLTGNIHLL